MAHATTAIAGTRQRSTAMFAPIDAPGTPTDPTAVTAAVSGPAGTTTPTPTRVSAGIWRVEWTPTRSGNWRVEIRGTGAVEAVAVDTVRVLPAVSLP